MGCATSAVKYLVFIFNFIFALAGLAIIAVGVLFKLNIDTKFIENDDVVLTSIAFILIIVVGVIIFVIAFFGCCGAIRESGCMLTTYAVLLLVLFIIQLAVGIYIFIEARDERSVKKLFLDDFRKAIDKYDSDHNVKEHLDTMQRTLHCCGAEGPSDYEARGFSVPTSCCIEEHCSRDTKYQIGCGTKVFEYTLKHAKIIAIVALGIALVELIGAIVALCLVSSLRNQYRRGAYA